MAVSKFYLLFVSGGVSVLVLAYLLHIPLPENLTDRAKLQIFESVMRVGYYYPSKLFLSMGLSSLKLHWTRGSLSFFAYLLGPWTTSDPDLEIHDRKMSGVPVRVYVPKGNRHSDGAILFIHGGGFVLMSVDTYDGLTRYIASHSRMVLISIDYRRAPEHVFPAGVEDCEAVARHFLLEGHREWGVDPGKVVVMGDSAGGNLATVTARRIAEDTGIDRGFKLQALLYPVVQYLDFLTPSYQQYYSEYPGTALLDPDSIARWLMIYLGVHPTEERILNVLGNNHTVDSVRSGLSHTDHSHLPEEFRNNSAYVSPEPHHGNTEVSYLLGDRLVDPDFSPLMTPEDDLAKLPKTYLMTCHYDILRDEGFWYARRLVNSGVGVEHRHYPQGFHAMLNFISEIQLARTAVHDVVRFVHTHIHS